MIFNCISNLVCVLHIYMRDRVPYPAPQTIINQENNTGAYHRDHLTFRRFSTNSATVGLEKLHFVLKLAKFKQSVHLKMSN
jgi:hypothetical protein